MIGFGMGNFSGQASGVAGFDSETPDLGPDTTLAQWQESSLRLDIFRPKPSGTEQQHATAFVWLTIEVQGRLRLTLQFAAISCKLRCDTTNTAWKPVSFQPSRSSSSQQTSVTGNQVLVMINAMQLNGSLSSSHHQNHGQHRVFSFGKPSHHQESLFTPPLTCSVPLDPREPSKPPQ